jgi:NADH:ubiquinone oxidoreductase subunit F (NADH-binding)/NADH:ubiquinone oxidoreductase subunit E
MSVNPIRELWALQDAAGYLRDTDLRSLSERLKIPLYELEGIASFYPHFRRQPPRPLRVGACRDLSCHLRDSGRSSADLKALCAGRDDVEFEAISCPGLCDRAPAFLVNDRPATPAEAAAALDAPSAFPDGPPTAPRRWQSDPYATPAEHFGQLRSAVQSRDFDAAIARIAASGLRGMGGAGFSAGRKWELVRKEAARPKYVVCNADESEPGAFKDRVILEELPHLVIEGTAIAALAVGAERGWIYIRHEYERAREVVESAIAAAYAKGILGESVCGSGLRFDLEIFVSPGGYILGEETALLEALEGRRGEPRNKPPFPGVEGLHGKPTLMNNVETLAQIPRIFLTGNAEFKFFSVSGDVATPGVVEAPLGISLRELIERCGGMRDGQSLQAFLPGGASTAFLPADRADIAMDWESLRAAGSALGAGAVVVVGADADLLELGRNLTAFFRNESCGKCVPCRIGTEKAVLLIEERTRAGLDLLPALNEALRETSLCGLGQVALTPILSILDNFPPQRTRDEKT